MLSQRQIGLVQKVGAEKAGEKAEGDKAEEMSRKREGRGG